MAAVLTAGCAGTPQTRAVLDDGQAADERRIELREVAFHPQERWQCGPAALATVLQWRGVEVTPEALVPEVYVPARRGSLQPEMLAATRRHGRVPYVLEPDLAALIAEVEAGLPVLVLQNLALPWFPRWHYAVVVGFDLDERELILRSGTTERLRTPMTVFERTWRRGDHWAIVVTEAERIPATAKELDWLDAVSAFERSGDRPSMLAAYRSALERWPDSVAAHIGIGNVHFRRGDHDAAAGVLRELLEMRPDYPPALNNLAFTLLQQGHADEARELARRAVAADPDNARYRRTLEAALAQTSDQ